MKVAIKFYYKGVFGETSWCKTFHVRANESLNDIIEQYQNSNSYPITAKNENVKWRKL